jgi:hypothetical protein
MDMNAAPHPVGDWACPDQHDYLVTVARLLYAARDRWSELEQLVADGRDKLPHHSSTARAARRAYGLLDGARSLSQVLVTEQNVSHDLLRLEELLARAATAAHAASYAMEWYVQYPSWANAGRDERSRPGPLEERLRDKSRGITRRVIESVRAETHRALAFCATRWPDLLDQEEEAK